MNPKLEGIVNRFANHKKIAGEFWEKYQMFSNYLLIKDVYYLINGEYPYESELSLTLLEDVNFGKNNTMAVDGCFFIHKKEIMHLNMDDDDIDSKLSNIKDGFLHIVLIQTKSGKLETEELSTLSSCLDTEFTYQSEWLKFVNYRKKCNALLNSNEKVNLKFWCYYVTGSKIDLGLFTNPTFNVREKALKTSMKNFFWISKDDYIKIEYIEDNKILDTWTDQEENLTIVNKTIKYIEITREIEIPQVGKILFGAITFEELMKIIYNTEKQKRYDLYGYNVRDEIEKSDIKKDIINTIRNNGDKFILLNNGITLVLDSQEKRGEN